MTDEVDKQELRKKLMIDASIRMTRDDVTEAIQEWTQRYYGVIVPNFKVRFEECDIANARCEEAVVFVELHHEDTREILNRFEGIETELEGQ